MAGYTKLFGSILDSTVWLTPSHVRLVWITMLAMADRDGIVEASVPGLAKRAAVTLAEVEDALACLMAPDPHSRTPDHEGRRIEAVDGGWLLLNHGKYRDKASADEQREKARLRMAAKRARDAAKCHDVTQSVTRSYAPSRLVTVGNAPYPKVRQPDPSPDPTPTPEAHAEIPRGLGDGEALILIGFQQRWQAQTWNGVKLGDIWPGAGKHMPAVIRLAPWAAENPERLGASLAGYFACVDPFVVRVRWNLATWLADPGRYIASDPAESERFGFTGSRVQTDEDVLGGG